MVQVKSSVFERVNSIYNSVQLTFISVPITANNRYLLVAYQDSKAIKSFKHSPFVPFFWTISILVSSSSLSCITGIALWLTSISDTDLKVAVNPDGGELDEFENWSSESTESLVTINGNRQILNFC